MASESIYAPKASGPLDGSDDGSSDAAQVPTNPYLTQPVLHVHDLDPSASDKDLASTVFAAFLPVRLHIDRSDGSAQKVGGTVEFQSLDKAEKALATIRAPSLSIGPDPATDPKPAAKPRLVKQLPFGTEDSDVFDMFRPYGPLESAARILTNPTGHHTGFRGMALVIYYSEEQAQHAQTEMHCADIDGKTISVSIDNVARRPSGQGTSFSPSATPFVPSSSSGGSVGLAGNTQSMSASAPVFQPPSSIHSPRSQSPHYAPQTGPMMAVPGSNLQYSATAATYIDPCNLFCKNLDASIDSNKLFTLFKDFGRIVSARVMRDEKGASREFGFVSYRRSEDASRALAEMNGKQFGSKQMIVRLHEPKSMRQEKLSAKFGASYSAGPGASPSGSGSGSPLGETEGPRQRRMSDSYFRAAASGEGGEGQLDVDQLQSMSVTLRGDILRGGFSRRVKELDDVPDDQVESLVADLSNLRLPEAVSALNDKEQFEQRVAELRRSSKGLEATAPAKETADLPASTTGTGDAASASWGALGGGSEREKLVRAMKEQAPAEPRAEELTDLLLGLPKKERAMALFNQDYLRNKIDEARAILEMADDDEDKENINGRAVTSPPLTKANLAKAQEEVSAKEAATKSAEGMSELAGASGAQKMTLAQLARKPAAEIVQMASGSEAARLPLPKADAAVTQETDAFIDSIKDLAPHDQKQKLGDQLFKKVRSFGVKGAPKITIALLDSEDLRALAHLMNSYPDCLREKIVLQAGTSK